ncbi:expressed protein [Arabidopsis lyrata subsp. lyrata]|uniref:Expressed protein n=1 Tax=Arabidopsis lyrata subsp. lyrata TaxID=81972 RepID=D7MBD8_ARALL|nr:expressed protein [Arabidopsis lyrata subsp. lyrata]
MEEEEAYKLIKFVAKIETNYERIKKVADSLSPTGLSSSEAKRRRSRREMLQ